MRWGQTTPSQEPKERRGTRVCRVHLDRTGGQVRVELLETRVQLEEEGHPVRRVHLDSQELWESQAAQVLQVLRAPEESEVNQDPEESPAFLELRVSQDQPETRDQQDAAEPTDRRANWEIQVKKELWDRRDLEECRVKTAETVTDPPDLKVSREILVSLVILVCRARTACRGPKDIQDPKGTGVEAETREGRESQAFLENQDTRDTGVPEVLPEAKA